MENTTVNSWLQLVEIGPKELPVGFADHEELAEGEGEALLDERQSGEQTKLPRQLTHHLANLNVRRRKHIWTIQQNNKMLKLHDQLGNKWSTISKQLSAKSDNDIKNHFFSQLRMALRNLNKLLTKPNLKRSQAVKPTILIKVTNYCQEQFNPQTQISKELIESAISKRAVSLEIKRSLFNFLYEKQENKKEIFLDIIKEIKCFAAKTGKQRKKKAQEQEIPFFCQEDEVCLSHEDPALESCNIFDAIKCHSSSYGNLSQRCPEVEKVSEEVKPDLSKPDETSELIARPSFCLENPLEHAQVEIDEGCWYEQIHQPEQSNFSRYLYPFQFKSFEL